MTCPRVRVVPPSCTCGRELDITVFHGDDDIGNDLCPTCSGCGCEPNERNERVNVPPPSTDGAPDPADVIARILYVSEMWKDGRLHTGGYDDLAPQHAKILREEAREAFLEPLTAAGLRVVPEDRPAPCPHCNDDGVVHTYDGIVLGPCDCPAGVPALDEDTRREVPEVLLTFAKWADWYLEDGCRRDHHGYCQAHGLDKDCPVGPMREWLAAHGGPNAG